MGRMTKIHWLAIQNRSSGSLDSEIKTLDKLVEFII